MATNFLKYLNRLVKAQKPKRYVVRKDGVVVGSTYCWSEANALKALSESGNKEQYSFEAVEHDA